VALGRESSAAPDYTLRFWLNSQVTLSIGSLISLAPFYVDTLSICCLTPSSVARPERTVTRILTILPTFKRSVYTDSCTNLR